MLIPALGPLGLSRGSASPDWGLSRPYALGLAWLLILGALAALVAFTRRSRPAPAVVRRWLWLLLVATALDYIATLTLAGGRILSVY